MEVEGEVESQVQAVSDTAVPSTSSGSTSTMAPTSLRSQGSHPTRTSNLNSASSSSASAPGSTSVSPKSHSTSTKGKFKLDPYSLLLPHERKMYQQHASSASVPVSDSASPVSVSAASSPSPAYNQLLLGKPVGHGHAAYPAHVQRQQQEIAGFGAAGAAMEADQKHFYAGQGHEQWQSAVQAQHQLQQGQQGPGQDKGQRLVSSMGEQGSNKSGAFRLCL